jgi:hypothetical protein
MWPPHGGFAHESAHTGAPYMFLQWDMEGAAGYRVHRSVSRARWMEP